MKKDILKYLICLVVTSSVLSGCKKDERYNPVQKNSLGVYYWFTNYNSVNSKTWIRTSNNNIWTWYNDIYKIFDPDNKLSRSFNMPIDEVYEPGYYGSAYISGSMINNERGNLENAYFYYNDDGPDPLYYNIHLKTVELSGSGIVNTKSVPIHYHTTYYDYFQTIRFTKTNNNYFFRYIFTSYDTSAAYNYPAFRDSLVFVKTDLNLNVLARTQTTTSDTLIYSYHNIYDLQENNSKIYTTRTDEPYYYYGISIFEVHDNDLNLLKTVSAEDVYTGSSSWYTNHKIFQKIQFSNNKIIIFGEKQESGTDQNTLLMTVFDLEGNLLNKIEIKTKKPSSFLQGVEACADGKFLVYYVESDDAERTSTYAGFCKIDENGLQDYVISFPENDPNNYTPCMAYENPDGTINIFAVKKGQQSPEQTIVVRMDRNGKIQ
jgi:hypothetical protein